VCVCVCVFRVCECEVCVCACVACVCVCVWCVCVCVVCILLARYKSERRTSVAARCRRSQQISTVNLNSFVAHVSCGCRATCSTFGPSWCVPVCIVWPARVVGRVRTERPRDWCVVCASTFFELESFWDRIIFRLTGNYTFWGSPPSQQVTCIGWSSDIDLQPINITCHGD
jgi:hypothetical protein